MKGLKTGSKLPEDYQAVLDEYDNHFVDREFPPDKSSIFVNLKSNNTHSEGLKKVKKWLRPNDVKYNPEDEIYPITLITDPTPKDVIQGSLGSCWFISALASLAQRSELIYNILVTEFYNPYGFHQVRLCIRGEWKIISIDDYLPCDSNGKLVFAYGQYRELWVSFVEKALAKAYGSYQSIAVGTCVEGLQTITGQPCEVLLLETAYKNLNDPSYTNLDQKNPNYVWQKLVLYNSKGFLMTTLCNSSKTAIISDFQNGLVNKHIYSILDAREFDNNGKMIRLLKLRNPWGKKEWKGAWSNTWPDWPVEIKNEISYIYDKNDGTFWISFEDILRDFNNISVCKIRTDMIEIRQSSVFYDFSYGAEVYAMSVYEQGQFEIELFSVCRKNDTFDRNAPQEIDLCIIICSLNDNASNLKCIAFEQDVKYYATLSIVLEPGYYFVYVTSLKGVRNEISSECKKNDDLYSYNLVIHADCNYFVNQYTLPAQNISDIFFSVADFFGRVRFDINNKIRTSVIQTTYSYAVLVENLSPNLTAKINIDMTNSENYYSTRNGPVTEDFLPPGTKMIINYLIPRNFKTGFKAKYKYNYMLLAESNAASTPSIPDSYGGLHILRGSKMI